MNAHAVCVMAVLCATAFAGQWVDLFQAPFGQNGPTIMMGISCVADNQCYVAGGSNGVGFGLYGFDGQIGGSFTQINEPSVLLMALSVGFGGTPAAPHGVMGGVSFGNGIQYYNPNSSELLPSSLSPFEFLVEVQDIRVDKPTGMNVLVVDGAQNAGIFSSNGGQTFTVHPITSPYPLPNASSALFGAMVSPTTWYIVMGSFPESNNNNANVRHVTEQLSYVKQNGQWKPKLKSFRSGAGSFGSSSGSASSGSTSGSGGTTGIYSAAIVKTSDGGMTWTTLFQDVSNYYFNEIDCLNATWCITVGQGFIGSGSAVIYMTTNGTTWNQVFSIPQTSTMAYGFSTVRFASAYEVWVGGSIETQSSTVGAFWVSYDAGLNWEQAPTQLPYIGAFIEMDFLPDGTGFAAAITEFQDSTLVRYFNGPVPTLAPGSPGSVIVNQTQCIDAQCSFLCSASLFPTLTCLQDGRQSVVLNCTAGGSTLTQMVYRTADCTGAAQISTQALNQCTRDNQGSYFSDVCQGAPIAAEHNTARLSRKRATYKH